MTKPFTLTKEAAALAEKMAEARGASTDEIVLEALRALEAERSEPEGPADWASVWKLAERARALGGAPLTDDELYDENGLPR